MSPTAFPSSGLLVEPGRVVPEELAPRVLTEARPLQDVVDGVGELTFRVRIIGAPHQHVVPQHAPDVVEHLLAFVALDAAKEPSARHVFAGLVLERRGAADVDRLLVHALRPERQPAGAALEDAHAQAGIPIEDPGADEGRHESHTAPWVRGETAEEDVVPEILVAGEVRRIPREAVMDDRRVMLLRGLPAGCQSRVIDRDGFGLARSRRPT